MYYTKLDNKVQSIITYTHTHHHSVPRELALVNFSLAMRAVVQDRDLALPWVVSASFTGHAEMGLEGGEEGNRRVSVLCRQKDTAGTTGPYTSVKDIPRGFPLRKNVMMWSERSSITPTTSPSWNRLCLRPREFKNVLPCDSFFAVPQARPQDRLPMGQVLMPMIPCDL